LAYAGEPFVHDIFVSYSHGDAEGTGQSRLKQWSQGFAGELEAELRTLDKFGRDVRVFLDQHHRAGQGIDPMSALTEQLRGDIRDTALLVVLMSPHYLRSQWCRDERDWWCEAQRVRGLPADGRIAVARIWPTSEAWPDALNDGRGQPLVGFCFYDKANAELRPQPYEWPEPNRDSRDPFRKELLTLVGWLSLKLDEMRRRLQEQRSARDSAAKLAAPAGQVVYLHGRAEYAKAWERAAEALGRSGLVVLPGEPDPVVSDMKRMQEMRARRVQTMSACDALLLVGSEDGRTVDADLVVVGRQDRNSARALSNQLLPCALLDGAGAAVATPQRKGAARSLNVEWIDATSDPWTPAVQTWLHDVARAETPGP
jgi:hypothetical protein